MRLLRPARLLPVFTLLLCAAFAFPAAAAPASPDNAGLGAEETALWARIAAARADAGLAVPALSAQATALARARSADMATRGYFDHVTPDGTTFLDMMPAYGLTGQLAGETLQGNNFPDSPAEAARGLIASPAHHAILFDPRYGVAGVGHAVGADGTHYFTIIVIQP